MGLPQRNVVFQLSISAAMLVPGWVTQKLQQQKPLKTSGWFFFLTTPSPPPSPPQKKTTIYKTTPKKTEKVLQTCLTFTTSISTQKTGICLFDAWQKFQKYSPKCWFDGDLPWHKVKKHLKQKQENWTATKKHDYFPFPFYWLFNRDLYNDVF